MKKVLFATTALVATTGLAAADVTLSGVAQMGIQGGENAETQFVQDIDVTFSLSGETDNGITFGAAIDLDENAGAVGTDDAGVAVFISGNFGTLTMGDTDGALDWALSEVNVGPGSINDDETAHVGFNGHQQFDANAGVAQSLIFDGLAGTRIARGNGLPQVDLYSTDYNTFDLIQSITTGNASELNGGEDDFDVHNHSVSWNLTNSMAMTFGDDDPAVGDYWDVSFALAGYDGQIVRYDYSVGDFAVAASVQLDDDGRLDPMWGIGMRYSMAFAGGSLDLGAAYQNGEIEIITTATYVLPLATRFSERECGDATCTYDAELTGTTVREISDAVEFDGGGLSAVVNLDSGLSFAASYTHHDVDNGGIEIDHVGLGVAYTIDAFSIGANWGQYDVGGNMGFETEATGWGLAASYDFGGGLTMHLGYGDGEVDNVDEDSTYSLGLSMSF